MKRAKLHHLRYVRAGRDPSRMQCTTCGVERRTLFPVAIGREQIDLVAGGVMLFRAPGSAAWSTVNPQCGA